MFRILNKMTGKRRLASKNLGHFMNILETIAPIFLIIAFGYFLKSRKILSDDFIAEANHFVFRFPLPFLIFIGIIKAGLKNTGWVSILSVTVPALIVIIIALIVARIARYKTGKLGSFVQSTFHGNVTYVGLAVLFYLFGEEGLERGSLLAGTLILFNNVLAIIILSLSSGSYHNLSKIAFSIITTPIIIATFAGIIFALTGLKIPAVFMKSMEIVANIALPLALIIIGGSISPAKLKKTFRPAAIATILKVFILPGIALLFCQLFSSDISEALPAMTLLATPTAITAYIMARELDGDSELASGAITLSTLVSPVVYLFWMMVLR